MDRFLDIKEKYDQVMERIAKSAHRSGRNPNDIKLVTVSKGQPIEILQAAVRAGINRFGENYAEESVPKIEAIAAPLIEWHMIGHVQSRKARLVCEYFDVMHSLDSLSLAEKLDRNLADRGKTMPVLLEFNVGKEATKSGWEADDPSRWEEVLPDIEKVLQLPNLKITGLMTMPPLTSDLKAARAAFIQLVRLQDYLAKRYPETDWSELSMGTSSDFEAAVEAGATFVRIGTSILGPRPPKIPHL